MDYDLELSRIVREIKKKDAKIICIQLPDGLKNKADMIQQEIENKTNAEVLIWAGSCYGACDIPVELKNYNIDLLIHFGHAEFIKK